jgi:hypothetical protein
MSTTAKQDAVPDGVFPQPNNVHRTGFSGVTALAGSAGKNGIFLQIHQTRKMLPADTSGRTQGGRDCQRNLSMNPSHLRVYYGPSDEPAPVGVVASQHRRQTVTVPLMEVLPLLADAVQSERTWLGDFQDDEVTISMDLYEVLLAYQHYRRPSA